MKKSLLTVFIFLLSVNHASAFNLGDSLKESTKGINKNVNGKVDEIVKKVEKKLDGEVAQYKKKIDAETKKIQDIVKETEDSINKIKSIKAKAESYIQTAKIIIAALSGGIIALIFVMWRIYRNVINLRKIINNVANYDDINARLLKVETELAKHQS